MYFKDRIEAGTKLVPKLQKYKTEQCAVVALSQGAVLVGAELAQFLHSNLMLLLYEEIDIPGEPDSLAAITSDNTMTYNDMYSVGEIEEFTMDYSSYIEQERWNKLHNLHLVLGKHGEIRKDELRKHNVILVSDGLSSGFSISIAANFLRAINYSKLVIATPFATDTAYDRMRLIADDTYCLNIVVNYLGVNHYYDDNNIPSTDKLLTLSEDISLLWK